MYSRICRVSVVTDLMAYNRGEIYSADLQSKGGNFVVVIFGRLSGLSHSPELMIPADDENS